MQQDIPSRSPWQRDAAVFLAALVTRATYLIVFRPGFTGPYWALAGELLGRGSAAIEGVTRTDFEPLYPLFLAALRLVAGDNLALMQIAGAVLSAVAAVLFVRLVRELTGRGRVAAIAAFLYVVDPLLIKQSLEQGPSVLVTALLIAFAYAVVTMPDRRWGPAVAGTLMGALLLARTMTLPLVACLAVLAGGRRQWGRAAAAVSVALLLASGWTLWGYRINGSLWPTRSGWNLYISSLPAASELVPRYDVDLLEPYADALVRSSAPAAASDPDRMGRGVDLMLTRQALANLAASPARTVRTRAANLGHFFWPPLVPYFLRGADTEVTLGPDGHVTGVSNAVARPIAERMVYPAYYAVILAAAIVGAILRRRAWLREDAILTASLATFALVHALYFPATRYRGPVTFVLLFYAAVALDAGAGVLLDRRPIHQSHATAA